MENASKALIIAGAILLSILIIGLGMTIYNNASSSMGNANLDAQEIQAHNSQFLAYQGKQKGTTVKALITAIRNNNREYNDRIVAIGFSSTTAKGEPPEISNSSEVEDPNSYDYNVKNNTTYFVTFGEGDNGCINSAEIHVYSTAD